MILGSAKKSDDTAHLCYVTKPSNCPDLKESTSDAGAFYSYEACEGPADDGTSVGEDCTEEEQQPVAQVIIIDSSGSLKQEGFDAELKAAQAYHGAWVNAYENIRAGSAVENLQFGVIQFSQEAELLHDMSSSTTLFDDVLTSFDNGSFKYMNSTTNYSHPIDLCVEMLKNVGLINGKEPKKSCVLFTDGASQDCNLPWFPLDKSEWGHQTPTQNCVRIASEEHIDIQTLFVKQGMGVDKRVLDLLSHLSGCDGHRPVAAARAFHIEQHIGTYQNGTDCPLMRSVTSSRDSPYAWIERHAQALVASIRKCDAPPTPSTTTLAPTTTTTAPTTTTTAPTTTTTAPTTTTTTAPSTTTAPLVIRRPCPTKKLRGNSI